MGWICSIGQVLLNRHGKIGPTWRRWSPVGNIAQLNGRDIHGTKVEVGYMSVMFFYLVCEMGIVDLRW